MACWISRGLMLATATTLLLVAALPASAHTTLPTPDGLYFITAGNRNEPVTTFTITGLDLTVRHNESGQRGAEVPGQHLNMTATLIAPNGAELTRPLETQHGAVGRYSFDEPYYLTQPGEYFVRVGGNIEGNPVDLRVLVGSGPIPEASELTFPDQTKSILDLQEENEELRSRLAALESRVQAMESSDGGSNDSRGSLPSVGPMLLLAILAAAFVVSRRNPPA